MAREIEIASEYWGPLEDVLVKKDDFVKKGQLLVTVRDVEGQDRVTTLRGELATYRSQRDEIARKVELRRAQLDSQNEQRAAERRRAQAVYQERVAEVSPERLQQAEASVDEAQAQLRQARRERERLQKLFDEDIASQAQVEKAQMEEEIALARRTRALKQLEELKKGPTPEAMAAARAEVGIADATLNSNGEDALELSLLQQQLETKQLEVVRWESELASYQVRLERSRISAPADGQVIQVHHFPGEIVHRGTPLVTLLQPDTLWVEADVAEQDSSYVSVGQEVSVRLPSLDGRTLKGSVESLGATLRTPQGSAGNARFLQIKVSLSEPVANLKPGVEADIQGSRLLAKDVLTVPHSAVIREGAEAYVMLVEGGKTRKVAIKVGVSDADKVEVLGGLSENQSVILDQPSRFADGTVVTLGG